MPPACFQSNQSWSAGKRPARSRQKRATKPQYCCAFRRQPGELTSGSRYRSPAAIAGRSPCPTERVPSHRLRAPTPWLAAISPPSLDTQTRRGAPMRCPGVEVHLYCDDEKTRPPCPGRSLRPTRSDTRELPRSLFRRLFQRLFRRVPFPMASRRLCCSLSFCFPAGRVHKA